MIYEGVWEHMTEDELRNYCCKVGAYNERLEQARQANMELADAYKNLVKAYEYFHDTDRVFRAEQKSMREYEDVLNKRYDEYTPKPVCDREDKE